MYTISRRRIIEEVFVCDYYSETEEGALTQANSDQTLEQQEQPPIDINEWCNAGGETVYRIVTSDDILEVVRDEPDPATAGTEGEVEDE